MEIPFADGNVSGVVRVGETVRRSAGPWTPAVHALLRYLREAGFAGCPEVLGMDEKGREVLSFVPGETAPASLDGYADDATLVAVATLYWTKSVARFGPRCRFNDIGMLGGIVLSIVPTMEARAPEPTLAADSP